MKDIENTNAELEWLGVTYKTILAPEDTGGAMSIVDSTSPVGSGPPRHIHHNEDEAFVVLTGTCRVWLEGEEKVLQAGESAFIPRGSEHTFKVIGNEACRHLVILTPGGFEGFFVDMAAGQFAIPDDMPAIVESGERHNMTFTGPPLD
ncbi:cupin domain-containing protein [Cognatishimia activa]|uniref:Quercetin 2,3-dioxygenase n=1 Tax=Cognatishimia activa TaxID=1715691 RepID=A0A0P1IPU1_9RHOB|nr:cupin domain-containing protein [Cognatishimia activa]CUJ19577.1 Quercetin 2,3-dioxygenase [Cognatishimia activa]CUK25531.1 Quercetin 2,3-dioxygenase [Cognatishimia activa]